MVRTLGTSWPSHTCCCIHSLPKVYTISVRLIKVGANGYSGKQFGDTTKTKIFVGGLSWETRVDTIRCYFKQFRDPRGRCHHRQVHSKIKRLWFFPSNIHSPARSARPYSETDPLFPQCCYLSSQLLQQHQTEEEHKQPAKGDRDLLRIFSRSELRKAFKKNGGAALVVPSSTSRTRLPACTMNFTLSSFLPQLRQAPSSRPTSPATAGSWCRWWCYSASSGTFSPTTPWSSKQSEINGFRGISATSPRISQLSLRHPA
ncbi:hypothetical protein ACFX2B_012802 [Malus domestica]